MLQCPKCQNTYEEGSRRFCPVEGTRLLPVKSVSETQQDKSQGVFTSLLNRQPSVQIGETPAPRYKPVRKPKPIVFEPVSQSKVFKNEPQKVSQTVSAGKTFSQPASENRFAPRNNAQANRNAQPVESKNIFLPSVETKTPLRLIREEDVPSGTLDIAKAKVNLGETGFIFGENPEDFVGKTVKGRYLIKNLKNTDEAGFVYLATDNLSDNKKVLVRFFKNEHTDDLTEQILSEERVSLSLVKHPNIVSLIDSGELADRTKFIVSEFADGETIADKLNRAGKFDPRRAARIIRQTAHALAEAHQNGVLHRNLKPQNIILTVNDAGVELVKVKDFAISDGSKNEEDLAYLAPEQINEKPTTFSSDIFSLAVIAYKLLTNRFPFDGDSEEVLQNLYKRGVILKATDLRENLPFGVDEVLEKALSSEQNERYAKARDFGDAFFNVLVRQETISDNETLTETSEILPEKIAPPESEEKKNTADTTNYISFKSIDESEKIEARQQTVSAEVEKPIAVSEETLWEKRSPEPPQTIEKSRMWITVLGLVVLVAALWGIWQYFLNRAVEPEIQNQPEQAVSTEPTGDSPSLPAPTEVESPPAERQIIQPAETTYFQNKKENLDADLAKSFRGFSLYYPNGWTNTPSRKNFIDVAKKNENGVPVEQMLVSFYESKGTFKADKEKFPTLVKESNKLLAKQLPNYRFVSEKAAEINDGWKVYEMKFEAKSVGKNGEPLTIYGRRIFMPSMREGIKTGFLITMLATSLSPDVKSVEDVGTKGGLKTVLETFEPAPLF